MKTSNLGKFLSVILIIASHSAWAEGDGSRGGGSAVILPDDTVVLADPYIMRDSTSDIYDCKGGKIGTPSKPLVAELERVGKLLVRYGASTILPENEQTKTHAVPEERSAFIEDHVLNGVTYCFVKKLPAEEPIGGTAQLPQGAAIEPIGYTEGGMTWVQEDLFSKMPVREQAKFLVHERLHAFAGNVPLGPIYDITNGLEILLSNYNQQQKGLRPYLTEAEVNGIATLMQRIRDLQLSQGGAQEVVGNYSVVQNGGGLATQSSMIKPSAYIGIGSVVGNFGSHAPLLVEDGVEIIDSFLCANFYEDAAKGPYYVDAKAVIQNSWIGYCSDSFHIFSNALISNSNIAMEPNAYVGWPRDLQIHSSARILNSQISWPRILNLGEQSLIQDSQLEFFARVPMWWDSQTSVTLELEPRSKLLNMPAVSIEGTFGIGFMGTEWTHDWAAIKIPSENVLDFQSWKPCTAPIFVSGSQTWRNPEDASRRSILLKRCLTPGEFLPQSPPSQPQH